jgi:hypothetical protein
MNDTMQQVIRKLMGPVAAILVAKGYADESTAIALVGAAVAVADWAWWFFWNKKRA